MRRYLLCALFLVSCTGCATLVRGQNTDSTKLVAVVKPPGLLIGIVLSPVQSTLEAAQSDSIERIFEVYAWHIAGVYGGGARPTDLAVIVDSVFECTDTTHQTAFQKRSPRSRNVSQTCPDWWAETIHTHPGRSPDTNCSASYNDYAFQLVWRHLFDAIMCGKAPPTFLWWDMNPLLATGEIVPPDTRPLVPRPRTP